MKRHFDVFKVANAVDIHKRDKTTVLLALPRYFDIKLPFPDARYKTILQISQAIILHATTNLHKDDPALRLLGGKRVL